MHGQVSVDDALRARTSRVSLAPQADTAPATGAATLADALQAMFASADVVFAGEVIRIERGEDVVTVLFAVEDAIRGVAAGSVYSLHEWSGLWTDQPQRYAVGEHLLMLLHAPSVTGLGSPVRDGAIALRGDAATGTADLRWVALHLSRSDSLRADVRTQTFDPEGGATARREAETIFTGQATTTGDERSSHVDRAVVMDMLHAWQRDAERLR